MDSVPRVLQFQDVLAEHSWVRIGDQLNLPRRMTPIASTGDRDAVQARKPAQLVAQGSAVPPVNGLQNDRRGP